MDEILASIPIGDSRGLHIATLSRNTIVSAGAEHLGCDGYFIFETCDEPGAKAIDVLCKVASLEAAFRMIDLWSGRQALAA